VARRWADGGVGAGDRCGSAAAACRLARLCCRVGADLPNGAVLPDGWAPAWAGLGGGPTVPGWLLDSAGRWPWLGWRRLAATALLLAGVGSASAGVVLRGGCVGRPRPAQADKASYWLPFDYAAALVPPWWWDQGAGGACCGAMVVLRDVLSFSWW
jgi:hypothetical protein